jgi:MOSC domain-containing protein YiiM
MTEGSVEFVHVARDAGEPVERVESVAAVAGKGLRGDRYFEESGSFSDGEKPRGITLIEAETLEAVEADYDVALEPGAHRRNVTVRGVALNHLVGERFRVGDAVCEGVELCEPCNYLEGLLEEDGVRHALVHRGGLRAGVVESGEIREGDVVEPL